MNLDIHTVTNPNTRKNVGIIKIIWKMFKNTVSSRDLIYQLLKRDLFATYKKSFIGISWILISPIINVFSWVFLHQTGLLNPGEVDIPYPAYVLISTSIWGLFITFYRVGTQTLAAGSKFSQQINYHREILLIEKSILQTINFTIVFIINLIVIMLFGVIPSWKIVYFPLVALPLFFLGAGIGLVTSLISVVAVDLKKAIGLFVNLLMWITPVIYSSKIDNELIQQIIPFNPLTYLISSARDIIISGELYQTPQYFLSAFFSLIVFLVAIRLFFLSENRLIERMV